jgi:ATP-binding cassette subfamily A (ABC1) protein 3
MYQSILKEATGNKNLIFKTISNPFPITKQLKEDSLVSNSLFCVFGISIAFSLIPTYLITFIMQEKESDFKQFQVVNGMSLFAYWFVNYIFDLVRVIIPVSIVIGLSYAFSVSVRFIYFI